MISKTPARLIRAYRRIPVRMRDLWDFGTSTSHLALAAVEASSTPWRTLASWSRLTLAWQGRVPSLGWNDLWKDETSVRLAWKMGEGGKGAP